MAVQGISHLTFVVRDLDRMSRLLCEGLGAEEATRCISTTSTTICSSFTLARLNKDSKGMRSEF